MLEEKIKSISRELGFENCRITKAIIPEQDKQNILNWVKNGLNGEMTWFEKNLPVKLEFKNLGFEVKSVILLSLNYLDKDYENVFSEQKIHFSKYAVGEDYHDVIKEKAKPILDYLKKEFPKNFFRQGVDSLPISEKVLAKESGLGWQGKNTNIIHPEFGSYFFISAILTDLDLQVDEKIPDRCGSCRACIDACPTNAIFDEYKIDATKCISYLNIEKKSKLSDDENLHSWIYGCDICQDVCPWNFRVAKKKNIYTNEPKLKIKTIFKEKPLEEFQNFTESEFDNFKKNSATSRISFEKFKENFHSLFE